MRFTVTPYDDQGSPAVPSSVDLAALRIILADAATTGRRLHIRPVHRGERSPATAQEDA